MRALRFLSLFLVLGLAAPAFADDVYIGTIVGNSSTSTNNLTTATPFVLRAKSKVSLQCDAAVYVVEGSADSGTGPSASASNGVTLSSGQLFDIALGFAGPATNYAIAILSVSGTANCKVFLST